MSYLGYHASMGNREKLLAGARRCLYEKGYADTTARDIVAASGTNLASIGYHFGSKDALLTAAMVEGFRELGEELARVLSSAVDGGPAERLESLWSRVIETFETHRPLWVASFEAFVRAEHEPELRAQLADGYELTRPWMAARLVGSIDDVDEAMARSVGSLLVALQAGLAAQWLLDPEHAPSAREVTEGLLTICSMFGSMAARPAGSTSRRGRR
jgi:AcrR family transcriptional regulator